MPRGTIHAAWAKVIGRWPAKDLERRLADLGFALWLGHGLFIQNARPEENRRGAPAGLGGPGSRRVSRYVPPPAATYRGLRVGRVGPLTRWWRAGPP